jgi:hypothetical protein
MNSFFTPQPPQGGVKKNAEYKYVASGVPIAFGIWVNPTHIKLKVMRNQIPICMPGNHKRILSHLLPD